MTAERTTKHAQLLSFMASEQWDKALSMASKFWRMDEDKKERVTRAHNARLRPDFYRQLGKDSDALVADGIEALKETYWK